MRPLFLLGSGISIDAKMPSTDDIGKSVRSGQDEAGRRALRHPAGHFYFAADDPNSDLHRPAVDKVLQLLGAVVRAASCADAAATTDYESLSYLLQQVTDAILGEYENPAVLPFADLIRCELGVDRATLARLGQEALHYINDTVASLIHAGDADCHGHLPALTEACRRTSETWLVTLNHDLLLESALDAAGIAYSDGFDRGGDAVSNPTTSRFWVDEWATKTTRVLKLHGSIDWYRSPPGGQPEGRIVARRDQPPEPGDRPILLTGTFSKILQYQTGIFPALHARFHGALVDASHIVVIGYGFRDKAINARLINWMTESAQRRMILCHPKQEDLSNFARPAIQREWENWGDRVHVIPKRVGDLSWDELAAAIG